MLPDAEEEIGNEVFIDTRRERVKGCAEKLSEDQKVVGRRCPIEFVLELLLCLLRADVSGELASMCADDAGEDKFG